MLFHARSPKRRSEREEGKERLTSTTITPHSTQQTEYRIGDRPVIYARRVEISLSLPTMDSLAEVEEFIGAQRAAAQQAQLPEQPPKESAAERKAKLEELLKKAKG